MRILFIHNQYIYKGGEDTVFDSEYNLLKEHGHDVQSLLFDNKKILSLKDKLVTGFMTFFNIRSAKQVEKKIFEFQPDVIHVHNFFPLASPSVFFVAHWSKIPIVMTLHNYRLICPSAVLYRNNSVCELCINKKFALDGVLHGCYRESIVQTFLLAAMTWYHTLSQTWQRKITRYIALTHFEKRKFLQSSLNLSDKKIVIKPNFVEDYGYSLEKEDYFLYVGRLSKEKGVDTVLKAFEHSDQRLIILGTGPLEEEVKKSVLRHPNIEYFGFQNKAVIIQKLKHAKALIVPSVCYETFGITIIEAFSTATPVICSNIGAPAEIVQNHINGLHFKAGDHEDLREKINWLDQNHDKHQALCHNTRKEFEAKYTAEKNYDQLIKIYEKAIFDKKTSS